MTNEQAAIKLQNILNDDTYSWHPAHAEALETAVEALKANDLVNESGGLVKDSQGNCISRQAAIDALDNQIEQCDKALGSFDISMKDEYAVKVERASLIAYKEQLEYLPSAQLEQRWIPCGKCIHADGKHRRCKVLDRTINEDYFCYWAEPFREEGEADG